MTARANARLVRAGAAMLVTLICSTSQSIAAEPPGPPDADLVLPAGVACPGFDLEVEIWNNDNRVTREFTDKNGNVVRLLTAGQGNALTFTNLSTGKTLSPTPNGAVEHITLNADGSFTEVLTGHNVLILFSTDLPAGPSTTLYVGRVVFTVDTRGVFTVQSTSGTATDLCAALD